ncbi:12905_t:CDS:2 [Funneliformis geosporum]|nr:12905_t:CDS:2 [Funneliformis geosporum]
MTKKLAQKIIAKLAKLNQLLDQIDEAQDKIIKGKYDEFDQPLTEPGLASLMDDYESEDEEDE